MVTNWLLPPATGVKRGFRDACVTPAERLADAAANASCKEGWDGGDACGCTPIPVFPHFHVGRRHSQPRSRGNSISTKQSEDVVACMERSAMRVGGRGAKNPGFRCAPSRLRYWSALIQLDAEPREMTVIPLPHQSSLRWSQHNPCEPRLAIP